MTQVMLMQLDSHDCLRNRKGLGKGKGKVHPTTDHEGPEGENRYNYTLSLTSALDRGWSPPQPGTFTSGNDPVPIV
jgi:hypothetical protein